MLMKHDFERELLGRDAAMAGSIFFVYEFDCEHWLMGMLRDGFLDATSVST